MKKGGRDPEPRDPPSSTERTPLVGLSSRRRDGTESSPTPTPTRRARAGSWGEVFGLDDDRKVYPAGSCRSIFQLGGDDASCVAYPRRGAPPLAGDADDAAVAAAWGAGTRGSEEKGGGPNQQPGHARKASDWSVGVSNATAPHRNVVSSLWRRRDDKPREDPISEERAPSSGRVGGWGGSPRQQASATLHDSGGRESEDGLRKGKHYHSRSLIPKHYALTAKVILFLLYALLTAYTLMVVFGPLVLLPIDKSEWCPESIVTDAESAVMGGGSRDNSSGGNDDDAGGDEDRYENPDYITDPCRYRRVPQLMFLTLEECDLSRRMLASVLFGGAIGYERRSSDRPAGIRTMGLVSLGSCFFTISSMLAFKSSTMGWDSSRVTAAIPSGVGFLGAGLIWKGTIGSGDEEMHQVHGLTTAASVWLSAAVGVGAGGALYFVSAYSAVLVTIILRYGPKLYLQDDASYNDEDEDDADSGFSTEEDLSDHPSDAKDVDDENRESESGDERAGECDKSLESFSQGIMSPQSTKAKLLHGEALTTRAANLWALEDDRAGDSAAKATRDDGAKGDKHVHGPLFPMQSDLTGPSLSSFAIGYDLTSSMRSIPGRRRSLPRSCVQFDTETQHAASTPKRAASAASVRELQDSKPEKSAEKKRRHRKPSVPSFHS